MKSSVKEVLARRIFPSVALVGVFAAIGARGVENKAPGSVGFSAFASAPLYFEANTGQFEGAPQFIARGAECSVFLGPTQAEILLGKSSAQNVLPGRSSARSVTLQLAGANPASKIAGREPMPAKANYFVGNDPAQWRTGVPLFSKVQVDNVYPGVQVIYYANQSAQLEYDFLLQPRAHPEQIRFQIGGADNVRVDAAGNLVLKIGADEIQQHKPVAYQESRGTRKAVEVSYHLNQDGTVGFALGDYDPGLALVIDPSLDFLTYIGGKKLDIGWAITVDPSTNIYVAGETLSTDLPTTNFIQFNGTNFSQFRGGNRSFGDAFVAKYDNSGALQFLTYLGGKTDDGALGIAYDSNSDAVWITGFTDSTNFPLVNPVRDQLTGPNKNANRTFAADAFLTKLDPSGSTLLFSTYFGGDNIDEGVGIAVDETGSVYATGLTSSTNLTGMQPGAFQTVAGGNLDAFITKLMPLGSNLYTNAYTTFIGGTNTEYGLGIAVDSGHDAWITGLTFSTNFFTANAIELTNAFFTDGIVFSNLNAQPNTPHNHNDNHSDAFVTELSADGLTVPFSTYLGGSNDDVGEKIAIDSFDNVFVTGYTLSRDFPTNRITLLPVPTDVTNQIVFANEGTNFIAHVFVTEISNHALAYSTHFGGSRADQGLGIAVDNNGQTYVTGSTTSTNFVPTILVVTNFTTKVKKNETITNYFGFVTNSVAFTNLSSTNITVKLKHKGNTNDVFLTVLSPEFTNFNHVILLGGPGEDEANALAIDPGGNAAYIVGSTTSTTNFATPNAAEPIFGGGKKSGKLSDAFVGKIQIVPVP